MRNREEFKSLVYEKRDRLLYEELEKKKKLNKRNKLFAVLSSAMAAVIVMAVVIPNAATWMSYGKAPAGNGIYDPEIKPENDGNGGNKAPSEAPAEVENAVATDAPEKDEFEEPSESVSEEVEMPETTAAALPEVVAPTASETSATHIENVAPEASSPLQVKFTATLSTYYAGYSYTNDGVVGELADDEKLSDLTMMITDYETLKTTFEGLCKSTYAAAVFGGNEIFDEDRVVIAIERTGGDPSDNEVAYSCTGFEDGTLYLAREYIRSGDAEVPCIEVRCVDFVVVNKYGFDLSQIENIVVTE